MSKFEVGQRVKIVGSTELDYNGMEGHIQEKGRGSSSEFDYWDWWVMLNDMDYPQGFDNHELAPADSAPQPAAADDVDPFAAPNEVYTTPYEALAFHVQCAVVAAMPEETWLKGWTPGQAVNEMASLIAAQNAQLATLQAELTQTRALLDDIAKLLPENRDHISDGTRSANVAWNAAIAADKIREYKAQQAAPGAAKGAGD